MSTASLVRAESPSSIPVVSEPPDRLPVAAVVCATDPHIQSLAHALRKRYQIKLFGSGEQAWAALQLDHDVDTIICSLSLPRMSGLDLCARIRSSRSPGLRAVPLVLVADSFDHGFAATPDGMTVAREVCDQVAAWDRSLLDLVAWLDGRLRRPDPTATATASADDLRRWAFVHRRLDPSVQHSMVVFRLLSEGLGVLSQRLASTFRRPETMLADSVNGVWICANVPISSAARFSIRLALSAIDGQEKSRVRMRVAYAPMVQLADETYDVLQHLCADEPPAGHLQVATHLWRFAMPFEAAQVLVR